MGRSRSPHTDQAGRRDKPRQWCQMERSEQSQLFRKYSLAELRVQEVVHALQASRVCFDASINGL